MHIDLHTHTIPARKDVKGLFNAPPVSALGQIPENWLVSTGIHPWLATAESFAEHYEDLEVNIPGLALSHAQADHAAAIRLGLDTLNRLAINHKIAAIGEIGLDRARGGDLAAQTRLLEAQLEMAETYDLPVVIHCVRAYPELLAVRKRFSRTPWIIHGFNGNLPIAQQLLRKNCHISFGAMLQRSNKLQAVARQITAKAIFLETDQSEFPIEKLYRTTAELLGIPTADLKSNITSRFHQIFSS